MRIFYIILCVLFNATLHSAEREQVAILLREPIRDALAEPLRNYVSDVEERFPVKLHLIADDWKTPEQVRSAIKALHEKQNVTGVILVGAMPMHRFYMHEFANPNPLYYEDFDLEFLDQNNDGFADRYLGKPIRKSG